jgi:hypothetical protein
MKVHHQPKATHFTGSLEELRRTRDALDSAIRAAEEHQTSGRAEHPWARRPFNPDTDHVIGFGVEHAEPVVVTPPARNPAAKKAGKR